MKRTGFFAIAMTALALTACSRSPRTAEEIVARSVAAHGGAKLTKWQTLTVRGRAEMMDLIIYEAAYTLQAKAPGKLYVEYNMIAGKGRTFREYFLNDGAAWSRQNLVVGKANLKQLRRWFGQCMGVARYANLPGGVTLNGESVVEWKAKKPGAGYETVETRPAYRISAVIDGETTEICIDKQSFFLAQETTAGTRRTYHNFKSVAGVVWPTEVLEIVSGRQGETVTPITYQSIIYDQPIEDWVFAEDMPARASGAPQ